MSDHEPIEAAGLKLFFQPESDDEEVQGLVWLASGNGTTLEEALASDYTVCIAVGPRCLDELAEGLRQAKRWYGEEAESNLPSPDPTTLGFAVGVACMVLGVRIDRISYATRLRDGRLVIDFAVDGKPLRPSQVEEIVAAARGAGVE